MKPLQWRRSKAGPFLRRLPRLKHVRGTWLHRTLGDRVFGAEMWQPERSRFAAGAAVGVFFCMMPFPFQMFAAAFIALLTRVNLPAAIICTWVSNPLTMPVFLYLQYKIGAFLLGKAGLEPPEGGLLELLQSAPLPVLVGAFICGVLASALSYPLALMGWDFVTTRLLHRAPKKVSG